MYYTGQVKAKDLFATILTLITQVQPGESTAWWKKESSLDADGVYTSKGSTGNERIVLILREDIAGRRINVGVAKDYTPGLINTAGAFVAPSTQYMEYFTATQNEGVMVGYDLSVTPDRVIIHLQGDPQIATWANPVSFLGMPLRYDVNDKLCIVGAISESAATAAACPLIEDSIGRTSINYSWAYTAAPDSPAWGDNYFLEVFHFGLDGEGLRGEIDGLYGIHSNGIADGDIIDVNGVKYKAIRRVASGNNSFPRDVLLMRQN